MGAVYDFEEEKMIIGVIYHDEQVLREAMEILTREFGETDGMCEEFSFSGEFSDYYDEELGGEGLRRIYSFKRTVDPSQQAKIKQRTNEIEMQFSVEGKRRINLDPGFINHGRLMLATTKNAGFRIPLADGIYTEMTLFYARGQWHKLPWTYRDYQSERVQSFITEVRHKYLLERRAARKQNNNQ